MREALFTEVLQTNSNQVGENIKNIEGYEDEIVL